MTQPSGKKTWKFFLIGFIVLIVLLVFLAPTLVSYWLKHKLIRVVNDKTPYQLTLTSLELDGFHSVTLSQVDLKPKLDKEEFNKAVGEQIDWIHFKAGKITLEGVNLKDLYSDKTFWADRLVLEKPEIYAYRDKRLKSPPFKRKPLPAELLKDANVIATIPLIEVKNGMVTYEEMPENNKPLISISFTSLFGSIYGVSTDPGYYHEHPEVKIDAKGLVLDKIKSTMTYSSSTLAKDGKFIMEAHLGAFKAEVFNEFTAPQASAVITSGEVDSLWFKFEANDDVSEGILHMDYKDLKITAKPKKKPKKFVELKSLLSKLFVKEQNQTFQKEKLGHIHFERTKDRFIFNYIWNSFKTGVASVVINVPDRVLEKQIGKKKQKNSKK